MRIVRLFLLMSFLLIWSGLSQSQVSNPVPTQIPGHDAILLGTDWYPEQWPESRWEEDLRLMEAAHVKVVRISEFAWSMMEPSEGQFNFDLFDRAVVLAAKHNIVTVVGTPSAAPPAWLTQKYPETLRIDENGKRARHGNRAQASPTSPKYRELGRRMAEQMALHFGHNPNVVGWQIDNEYGYAQMSYDDGTKTKFQGWLKDKYKRLDNHNTRWTTSYWSQT